MNHVSTIRESKIQNELSPNTFQVASVDNVDMLLSYPSVHAGRPKARWNGLLSNASYKCTGETNLQSTSTTPVNQHQLQTNTSCG